MKPQLKNTFYAIIVLLSLSFAIQNEKMVNQNTYKTRQGITTTEWWQIGDYYTYQEINHSKVNITYTLADEIIFNGTTVFNVTSSVSERPSTIMWNESYQENHYRTTEAFDLIGKKVRITMNAVAYYQVHTSVENSTYQNHPKLADYREGVNIWRETSYSEVTYDQSNYEGDPDAPPLTVYSETYTDINSTMLVETSGVVVPAGHFDCWKIEYLYTVFPVSSAPTAKNHTTIWNQTGMTLKDGPFYTDRWENSTQLNSTHVALERWQDNNGTIVSGTFYLSFLNKRVIFIDKTLGVLVKSVDYWMGEYYHGYELSALYLASPPPTTTTTTTSTSTTSPTSSTITSQPSSTTTPPTTSSTTVTTTTSATPLWISVILLLSLSFTRKRRKNLIKD